MKNFSNENLLAETKKLVSEERSLVTEILKNLLEIEKRRAFAELGYSSLFEYSVLELKYSESSAHRKISAMRLLKEIPEIETQISDGSLSLSVLAQAKAHFNQEKNLSKARKKEILKDLENQTSRKAEKKLCDYFKKPLPQERARPVSKDLNEVKFLATDALLEDLQKLKGLLAHSHPHMTTGELIQYMTELTLKKLDPAEKKSKALGACRAVSTSEVEKIKRAPSVSLKARIFKRDYGRCTFISPLTGKACTSNHALQIDHITPYALGGETTEQSLRLLCAQHNRYEAERVFGRWG